jgi:Pyruvate/2-oxoacid:ferredoxin oxidoreductase gamma subunit
VKIDLLDRIKASMPSFSKGQRASGNYILTNYDKAAFMTASRLGEVTGVSESTVVRFATALDFDGYPELSLEQILNDESIEAVAVETDEIHLLKYAQMAADAGIPTLANMILVGKFLKECSALSFEDVEGALKKVVSAKKMDLFELNLKAIRMGYDF